MAAAQPKIKLGHVDFARLYSVMPELDSVKKVYSTYNKTIQDEYATMQTELENKYMDYQANITSMSDIIKQTKEAEITDLQTRIKGFEQKAAEDLQNKELELTSPIIEKARQAVKDVAKENGYTYIFNSSEGLLLYAIETDDILSLVLKKLGISEDALKKLDNKKEETGIKQ